MSISLLFISLTTLSIISFTVLEMGRGKREGFLPYQFHNNPINYNNCFEGTVRESTDNFIASCSFAPIDNKPSSIQQINKLFVKKCLFLDTIVWGLQQDINIWTIELSSAIPKDCARVSISFKTCICKE